MASVAWSAHEAFPAQVSVCKQSSACAWGFGVACCLEQAQGEVLEAVGGVRLAGRGLSPCQPCQCPALPRGVPGCRQLLGAMAVLRVLASS